MKEVRMCCVDSVVGETGGEAELGGGSEIIVLAVNLLSDCL